MGSTARDLETGREFSSSANVVINATGAFSDDASPDGRSDGHTDDRS